MLQSLASLCGVCFIYSLFVVVVVSVKHSLKPIMVPDEGTTSNLNTLHSLPLSAHIPLRKEAFTCITQLQIYGTYVLHVFNPGCVMFIYYRVHSCYHRLNINQMHLLLCLLFC